MDAYHPATVFSSIDENGRYAYGNQPAIAQWNLARLAETLLPLLGQDETAAMAEANAALRTFAPLFNAAYIAGFRRKLGLLEERPDDLALIQDLLERMAANRADFTRTFRLLGDAAVDPAAAADVRAQFAEPGFFDEWAERWRTRLADEGGSPEARRAVMRASNPAFIPRNHLVEEMIAAAVVQQDYAPFERLLAVLSAPYDDQPGAERYAQPPKPDEIVHQTFCGT